MTVFWFAALSALGVIGYALLDDPAELRLKSFVTGTKMPAPGCNVVK